MRPIGKTVADEFYVHLSVLDQLDSEARSTIQRACEQLPTSLHDMPNVAKMNLRTGRVSLLSYPTFFDEPFPILASAWICQPGGVPEPTFRTYTSSLNPPVLHRKELLVGASHPRFADWSRLTATAEDLGLFDDTSIIGFHLNWIRLLECKGYELVDGAFLPIGNDITGDLEDHNGFDEAKLQRHRTALKRTNLSAPVQLLVRHGFLDATANFFDFGCGHGSDVAGLQAQGIEAAGWDPHFRPEIEAVVSDVVNLGFVINVIEDPAERVEALARAFQLARTVLSVGVMLYPSVIPGKPYGDGFVTTRDTFQKYFLQGELKDYLEHVLHREAVMVGPGVAFIFPDVDVEQRFLAARYRNRGLASRLLAPMRRAAGPIRPAALRSPRRSTVEEKLLAGRPILDRLWTLMLDLGRQPEPDEVPFLQDVEDRWGSLARALSHLTKNYDQGLLASSAAARADDLCVLMAAQRFAKRQTFRRLETRLQRDIKAFFGDYRRAQEAGLRLLLDAANPAMVLAACRHSESLGLGWLDRDHSLQLHLSLVERLPAVLRAYVAAGLILWGAISDVQLVKIHIESGKLTLMEFDDFDDEPLPQLKRRIKVNLRKQDYELFEYGSPEFPMPLLYSKSRYLHEDYAGFEEQLAFDTSLAVIGVPGDFGPGPPPQALLATLESRRLRIHGGRVCRSVDIPDLDSKCGAALTFRDLIECGETQQRLGIDNLPRNPETYNALFDLAVNVLDPVIDYFGAIRLTYGFASGDLTRRIGAGIAPKLDQHAACEHGRNGQYLCARGGAACDFVVADEDMREVAEWICANLSFDRLYFYGPDRPVHVSFSPNPTGQAFDMVVSASGRRMPRAFRSQPRPATGAPG